MAKQGYILFEYSDVTIPIKVIKERRRNVRVALGKEHVILRMPSSFLLKEEKKYLDWAKDWIRKKTGKKKGFLDRFRQKSYESGSLKVGGVVFDLKIEEDDRKTLAYKLSGTTISLKVPDDLTPNDRFQMIKKALSRSVAGYYLPHIRRRVHEINNRYFKKKISDVKLKYNHTNWGSCSNNGNINLSTRLLFAPVSVIDYVIVHELAHLLEMNHSKLFWDIVSNVMPDYKEKEKWLKINGHLCDF